MKIWMRALVALALAASAVACSEPANSNNNTNNGTADGGSIQDAGQQTEKWVNRASQHESYVPDGYQPKDAARLIVIGDSISVGAGSSGNSLNYFALLKSNNDSKWPDEAATALETKFGHEVEIERVAVSGATTNDLAAQQEKLDQMAPFSGHSIVTITIGGNDLQGALADSSVNPSGALLDEAIANITALIEFLQDPEKFPDGTSIYLMAVYDPTDGKGQADGCFFGISRPKFIPALDEWREAYINLAKEKGFGVVDALGHFHGHGANFDDENNQYYNGDDNTRWFANDCIHPNDRGHSELRRLFYEAIDWSYTATP